MNYFEITAKCEEINESSYTVQSTGEIVIKVQLSLVVPSMRDRVLCELPMEKAPTTDQLSQWELDEYWLVVSADGMRALAFQRSNARAGEKPVGALVVFQAAAVREATSANSCRRRARRRSSRPNSAARNGKPSASRKRKGRNSAHRLQARPGWVQTLSDALPSV